MKRFGFFDFTFALGLILGLSYKDILFVLSLEDGNTSQPSGVQPFRDMLRKYQPDFPSYAKSSTKIDNDK